MNDIKCWFLDRRFDIALIFLRIRCMLSRHEMEYGSRETYEPDRCRKCYKAYPEDEETLHYLLNKIYCWFVERDWKWFERFNIWLLDNNVNMPEWWTY